MWACRVSKFHTIPVWETMHFNVEHMVRKHCIWAWNSLLTVSGVLRAAVTSASTHSPEAKITPPYHTAALTATNVYETVSKSLVAHPTPLPWWWCFVESQLHVNVGQHLGVSQESMITIVSCSSCHTSSFTHRALTLCYVLWLKFHILTADQGL